MLKMNFGEEGGRTEKGGRREEGQPAALNMSIGAAVRENAFSCSPPSTMLAVGLLWACYHNMVFVMLRHVPSYAHLPGVVFLII